MFTKSRVERTQLSQFRFRLPIPGWPPKRKKPWQIPQESEQIDREELIELFGDRLRSDNCPFTGTELAQLRLNKMLREVLYN